MAPSNLYRKIKHGTISPEDLTKIGKILGARYSFYFSFPNGTKIGKVDLKAPKKTKTA